tara:strand:+ start:1738 stop:1959 length:222 start_codon:yes stop_codon:yes gene_type:complete
MPELSKLTKAQLIDIIQQQEEEKYAVLKEELGLPYNTDEEWVDYIKSKSDLCVNCQRLEVELGFLKESAKRCY